MPATETTAAILSSGPDDLSTYAPGSNWTYTTISVPTTLSPRDVLVEMAASGICHTDLAITAPPHFTSPRIVGHEGAGYVRAIGSGVKKDLNVGDPVLLSFDHCGECESCEDGHPAYCTTFTPLNLFCVPDVFHSADDRKTGIAGKCFGQSSFAGLSVVKEACVLNARDLVRSKEELMLFAPLGCGIQTGVGAVLNLAKPGKRDRVIVFGLGGVGLSAVVAAVICGCKQIVAVDLIQSRIDLAKTFGATHGINTSNVDVADLEAAFKNTTGGLGPTVVVDTTGLVPVLTAALASLGPRGTLVAIGASRGGDYSVKFDFGKHMLNGTRIVGCCEGDSLPEAFIPQLIRYYREGSLPLQKMAKFYKAKDFKTAVHDMHTGETIKPILTW